MPEKLDQLGKVAVGDKFIFCAEKLLGVEFCGNKPPFEGQVLTVVGFEPRLKNSVVVRGHNGVESLITKDVVEKALTLKALKVRRVPW